MSNNKQHTKFRSINNTKANNTRAIHVLMNPAKRAQHALSAFQGGGALVETALICSVMVIFMLGIPMIGSLIDLKQTTIQASRYTAWETTIAANPNDLPEHQVKARFFKEQSAPITASETELKSNALWGELEKKEEAQTQGNNSNNENSEADPSQGLSLAERARVTVLNDSVATGTQDIAGELSDVPSKIGGTIDLVANFFGDWDVQENGLYRGHVSVDIEKNALLTDSFTSCTGNGDAFGCLQEASSILIDGWGAGNNEIIRDRTQSFVPTSKLEKVGKYASAIGQIPLLKEMKKLKKAFGCVKTNVIPSKELGGVSQSGLPIYVGPATGSDDC